jgi:hypothetical protein
MTMFEKLMLVLSDGNWHTTEELVQKVGHRFSATIHIAIKKHFCKIEKRKDICNKFEWRMLTANKVVR